MYYSPKTSTDGLVFHYDTGNTVRSYLGEPTTNLLPNGVAAVHDAASGNATLDLTLSSELKAGAQLHLKVKTTGSETFTFGTGIDGPTVTGSAGKTWTQSFWYDGTIFLPCGARIQID